MWEENTCRIYNEWLYPQIRASIESNNVFVERKGYIRIVKNKLCKHISRIRIFGKKHTNSNFS